MVVSHSRKAAVCLGALALVLAGCEHVTPDYHAAGRKVMGPALALPIDARTRYDGAANASERAAISRELAFVLIAESDVRCETYLTGLSVYSNGSQAGLGLLGASLSTAGGVATPERSANLLSALSALAGSSDRIITQSAFEGRDFSLVYAAVRQGRTVNRQEMFDATNRGAFDTWTPPSILSFVTAYDLNCGINYGLQEIGTALQERAAESARELQKPDPPAAAAPVVAPAAVAPPATSRDLIAVPQPLPRS